MLSICSFEGDKMTLSVVALVPDGIVLASESLATLSSNLKVFCPKCKKEISIGNINCPNPECDNQIPTSLPASHSVYANKLFQLKDRNIGITTAGSGFVTGRTTESHIREFESIKLVERDTIEDIASKLGNYFLEQAKGFFKNKEYENLAKDIQFITFIIAGYDNVDVQKGDVKIGKAFSVAVGKTVKIDKIHEKGYSSSIRGDARVVIKLMKKDPEIPIAEVPYNLLPLQDAIDYARFLIKTTIEYHRFATMIPTCGGEIEVATITPQTGFEWINRKKLK